MSSGRRQDGVMMAAGMFHVCVRKRQGSVRMASGWRQESVRKASGWRQDGVRERQDSPIASGMRQDASGWRQDGVRMASRCVRMASGRHQRCVRVVV